MVDMEDRGPTSRRISLDAVRDITRTHGRAAAKIVGGVMGVVILLAVVGGTIRLVGDGPADAVSPSDVDRLEGLWSTATRAAPLAGTATSEDTVFVGGSQGPVAYPQECTTPGPLCLPAWRGYVSGGPVSAPTLDGDDLFVGSSDGHVYAFAASCPAHFCAPLWNGAAGHGRVSTPGVNDDFVYVASDVLYAFPASCGTEGTGCSPAWTGKVPGRAARDAPAVGAGEIVVASASPEGGLVAYPAICLDPCRPLWTGVTAGPTTSVELSADFAYVVSRGSLMAFALSCRGACEPAWTGPFDPAEATHRGAIGPPQYDGERVYVGGDDGTLWVFPSTCAQVVCMPLRSYDLGDRPLYTPTFRAGVIFVTSRDGILTALQDPCGAGCAGPWVKDLGAPAASEPSVTDGAAYVADTEGTLHAFSIPTRR